MFPYLCLLLLRAASLALSNSLLERRGDDGDRVDHYAEKRPGILEANEFGFDPARVNVEKRTREYEPHNATLNDGQDRWKRPGIVKTDVDIKSAKKALEEASKKIASLDKGAAIPNALDLPAFRVTSGAQKRQYDNWSCRRFGKSSHAELRLMHEVFNHLYGASGLEGTWNQCYVAKCKGFFFAWCQMSVDSFCESAEARHMVVDRDPGRGTSCLAAVNREGFSEYHRYFWGHESAAKPPDYGGRQDVRECL